MEEILKKKIIEITEEIKYEEKITVDKVWLHVLKGKKLAYAEMLSLL